MSHIPRSSTLFSKGFDPACLSVQTLAPSRRHLLGLLLCVGGSCCGGCGGQLFVLFFRCSGAVGIAEALVGGFSPRGATCERPRRWLCAITMVGEGGVKNGNGGRVSEYQI